MRLSESPHIQESIHSLPSDEVVAGPSSINLDATMPTNGHLAKGNGFHTNGSGTNGATSVVSNGNGVIAKHGKSPVARVDLPGRLLYDGGDTDREEFVRLVIQSLRDVGYKESANTLEAESGYSMETPDVSQFRTHIENGAWAKAEAALIRLGVTDQEGLWDARFLIAQQKYLEILEAQDINLALSVLRNEIAPLNVDSEMLHTLSSLIMCADAEDLRQRAGWDGANGLSRQNLLANLHHLIPSSMMIPPRRLSTLLSQARIYQRDRCLYHNQPLDSHFSLYEEHQCCRTSFPNVTTTVLEGHKDEVWNIAWSHSGLYLASASKDMTAIIWRVKSKEREWAVHLSLKDHPYPVGCLAWSLDDTLLLTSAENFIKLWDTKTGRCIRSLDEHTEPVSALAWLPDGSGFLSAGCDRAIIHWTKDGQKFGSWASSIIRVTDLAITPDLSRVVTVGMDPIPGDWLDTRPRSLLARLTSGSDVATGSNGTPVSLNRAQERRLVIYDAASRSVEHSIPVAGEVTSVKVSQDSQFTLLNNSPNELHLYDLRTGKMVLRYTGHQQKDHVLRSCFAGIDDNFVASGSEDHNVYIWHRDTGTLLETLPGHGNGSVNAIAWNPRNLQMFASCSDDRTIRIWEPLAAADPAMVTPPKVDLSEASQILKSKGKTRLRSHGNSP